MLSRIQIESDCKLALVFGTVNRQTDGINARMNERSVWTRRCVFIDGGNRELLAGTVWRLVAQIPDKPMMSRFGGELLYGTNPVSWMR